VASDLRSFPCMVSEPVASRSERGKTTSHGRTSCTLSIYSDAAPLPPPADGRYSPVEQAEMVTRYLCESDLSGVTLTGHSLGGGIALLVAHRLHKIGQSDRLAGLVSMAGSYARCSATFSSIRTALPISGSRVTPPLCATPAHYAR